MKPQEEGRRIAPRSCKYKTNSKLRTATIFSGQAKSYKAEASPEEDQGKMRPDQFTFTNEQSKDPFKN